MNLVDWRQEMEAATVDLLARAFASNPLHVAAFGKDSVIEKNKAFFRTALSMFPGRRLVVVDGSKILGFMHWIESPGCRLPLDERVRLAPVMLREFGLGATLRVSTWLSAWAKSDPAEPHWHFGPIGVDPDAQGRGIGRHMLDVYCAELDDRAAVGFLETDKPENVDFYQKFSFEVVKEIQVIGVSTYLMIRKGKPA